MFDPVKESFYFISVFIQVPINQPGLSCVRAGRNDYFGADSCYYLSKPAAIIPFVRYYGSGLIISQQCFCLLVIGALARAKNNPSGVAQSIAADMDLGTETAPTTT